MRPRVIAAILVTVVAAAVMTLATGATFSIATSNAGDGFSAGTVYLDDNDGGAALLSLSSVRPGGNTTACVQVRFLGTLASDVQLYAAVSGSLAPYLDVVVTRGTETSPSSSCSTFSADAFGVIYSGTLSSYPAAYATGVVDPETWTTGTTHSYKLSVTLANNAAAQGLSATATLQWEARNQ